MKKKKLLVPLLVMSFLLPLLLILLLVFYQNSPQVDPVLAKKEKLESTFSEFRALYDQRKLQELRTKMEPSIEEVLSHEEGCDLVVSVYAELNLYPLLHSYSKRCLNKKKSSGIAYEGLAVSSIALGKQKETLDILEKKFLEDKNHERLLVSLAQLSFEQKLDAKARKYFLQLIKESEIWSAWLQRTLKFKRLFSDAQFVKDVSFELSRRDEVPQKMVQELLVYAKNHKLKGCVESLSQCLKEKES